MSRSISGAFQTYLTNDAVNLAVCVKLTKADGTILGFTSWTSDITFNTVLYEASNAVTGTAVQQEIGSGVDNLDIVGIIRSDRIADVDLVSGKYDLSKLELFLLNPNDITMGAIVLLRGLLGEVKVFNQKYSAEIRSLTQRMSQKIGELTSPTCRVARFGDARCTLNAALFQTTTTVASVIDAYNLTIAGLAQLSGYYNYGILKMLGGNNIGVEREIKNHTFAGGVTTVVLAENFPYAILAADSCRIEAGCDRLFTTCITKFSNQLNFRGEPHVPGMDQVLQRGRAG